MIIREEIERRKAEEIKSIRRHAMDKAKNIAYMLKEKYGAKKVILFGSVVKSSYLHKRTDIDLL